jgi:mannose-6-phosphate isomerase
MPNRPEPKPLPAHRQPKLRKLLLYPLTFRPIFKERVWGGRNLALLYRKLLPPGQLIGESWEISDRPGDISVVTNGPLAGKDLRWLMEHHERELLGDAPSQNGRFPLLVKILDAQERLSVQVHPPASKAAELGGEPKTEMWYIAQASPAAELHVGLKHGVTRADFEQRIQNGTVANSIHRVSVAAGDAMFLPSGRVHAIGGGLVIFEIQQNSDTTYRVFDWNRSAADGKPRELHVPQSLESIDFDDFEPGLLNRSFRRMGSSEVRSLVDEALFHVDLFRFRDRAAVHMKPGRLQIIGSIENRVAIAAAKVVVDLHPGEFCLIPAALTSLQVIAEAGATILCTGPGKSNLIS